MTQQPSKPRVGYLRSCMDRRFLAATRRAFEQLTGLKEDEYFHEAIAGGVLNNVFVPDFPKNSPPNPSPNSLPTPDGADYVYGLNGNIITLVVMGWQAHLDHCGGLGEASNAEIRDRFKQLINEGIMQKKYPNVQHVFLLEPTLTLNFSNEGAYYAWCNVDYTDLFGQACNWKSGRFGPEARSVEIQAGATNLKIACGTTTLSGATGASIFYTTDASMLTGGTKNIYFEGSDPQNPSYRGIVITNGVVTG
ncbi:MAG TPA: hypothetical protein VFU49_08715 [Ktedonobacteraceae bacterium]|nr:hypothetical protein [Ktedonobacteraceae bacterium]